jgi:hypothetical protein
VVNSLAFGVKRQELQQWKEAVARGEIAYLTHYWTDPRFQSIRTVTKVGCSDRKRLTDWCKRHGLNPAYIHEHPPYPHFDLMGPRQKEILEKEQLHEHIRRFRL